MKGILVLIKGSNAVKHINYPFLLKSEQQSSYTVGIMHIFELFSLFSPKLNVCASIYVYKYMEIENSPPLSETQNKPPADLSRNSFWSCESLFSETVKVKVQKVVSFAFYHNYLFPL